MSFLDFRFSSNWERVVYKIWVSRRNSPKVTYLIFRRGSTGESFFFHGLIDFMLFLILAWRRLGSLMSQIFFCLLPGILALVRSAPLRTLPNNSPFLLSISADGGRSPLPFWRGPSQSFGFSLLSPWSGDCFRAARCHPSQVTQYKHLLVFTPTYILS